MLDGGTSQRKHNIQGPIVKHISALSRLAVGYPVKGVDCLVILSKNPDRL